MIYPEIKPDWGYSLEPVYKTDRLGPTDGDFTQRRRRRSVPLYRASLNYSARLEYDKKSEIIEFFKSHYGGWQSFTFYDFAPSKIDEYQIGTGDDATTAWVIDQYRDTVNPIVRFDGVAIVDFVIENRLGADGQDVLTVPTPPVAGTVITFSGDGYLRVENCIFEDDNMAATLDRWRRYAIGSFNIIQVSG